MFGGLAFIAAVALWHRPGADHAADADDHRSMCEKTGSGDFCVALARLSQAFHRPLAPFVDAASSLPPPETPGATDPAITQANIDATVCRSGYARSTRPPYTVTGPLKRRLMDVQHPGEPMAAYELDHLIPISIGGAPLDRRDLWLQPRSGQANAGDKNALAFVLWRLVCEHRLPLATAQRDISGDWIRAYRTYATPENLAKYHFRHSDGDPD